MSFIMMFGKQKKSPKSVLSFLRPPNLPWTHSFFPKGVSGSSFGWSTMGGWFVGGWFITGGGGLITNNKGKDLWRSVIYQLC